MIASLFEFLIVTFWNLVRRAARPRPRRIGRNEQTAVTPGDTVCLGTILRSPFAPIDTDVAQPTELRLTIDEKRRHLYMLGATGSGKTNLLLQLVKTDVEQQRGVCLIDFRGELVDRALLILASLYRPEEIKDRLVLIDLRQDDCSVPFNPLREEAADIYTRTRFVLEVLKQQWEIGVQSEQLLRNSLLALCGSWSLYELDVFLSNRTFRSQVLETVTDISVRRFFARFDQMENPSAWVEPVLNKISPFLARPVLRNMLAQRETISFHRLLDRRPDCIILISLAADQLFGDAHLLGSLLTSALISAAMRPDRRDKKGNELALYLDEFEHFDGLGEQFATILSEGRKFGLCATLSHQTSIQLSPKFRSLIRNVVGTQIFFGVGGGEAETLAAEIASDEPKAVIRNLLMNQKIGECVVVRRGHPYTRIRTRDCPDPVVQASAVAALRLSALQNFGTARSQIEADLAAREAALSSPPPAPVSRGKRSGKTDAAPAAVPGSSAVKDGESNDTVRMREGAHTILEVREHDDSQDSTPARTRRRKGAPPA